MHLRDRRIEFVSIARSGLIGPSITSCSCLCASVCVCTRALYTIGPHILIPCPHVRCKLTAPALACRRRYIGRSIAAPQRSAIDRCIISQKGAPIEATCVRPYVVRPLHATEGTAMPSLLHTEALSPALAPSASIDQRPSTWPDMTSPRRRQGGGARQAAQARSGRGGGRPGGWCGASDRPWGMRDGRSGVWGGRRHDAVCRMPLAQDAVVAGGATSYGKPPRCHGGVAAAWH